MNARGETRTTRLAVGKSAEATVAEFLVKRGFDIVARNLRIGRLEVDLVARHQDLVVVVEVRTRGPSAWTTGFGSLDTKKRARIRRAGERLWQRRYKKDETVARMRFDAASVTYGPEGAVVEYAEAAF